MEIVYNDITNTSSAKRRCPRKPWIGTWCLFWLTYSSVCSFTCHPLPNPSIKFLFMLRFHQYTSLLRFFLSSFVTVVDCPRVICLWLLSSGHRFSITFDWTLVMNLFPTVKHKFKVLKKNYKLQLKKNLNVCPSK